MPFLLKVLRFLGFGPVWCGVLSKLLSSSSTRVLINGEPGDLISHQRGLSQGDPLLPMLFIMVMDVLNSMVCKAVEMGYLQPLLRRGHGQRISLYVDDVVIFLQSRRDELALTNELLRIFGNATGLVTNISKSSITPIQCRSWNGKLLDYPFRVWGFPRVITLLPLCNGPSLVTQGY
jgi:hypothetical protein